MKEKLNVFANFVKQLDFIGPEYRFEEDSSSRYQSFAGFLFSLLCGISCVIIGTFFGKEIYEKKLPAVNISQQFVKNSDIFLNEFPIMFSFLSSKGDEIKLNDIYKYLDVEIYSQSMDEKGIVSVDENIYKFDHCHNVKFNRYNDLVNDKLKNALNKSLFCLENTNSSLYFSNSYLSLNSTNFNFVIKKCSQNCAPDYENMIENMLVSVIYPTSFVDIYNYTTPILTYLDELTTQTSNFLTRRTYFRFIYNIFVSNNGIVFDDYISNEFAALYSVVPDDLVFANNGPNKDILFWLALESPKINNLYNRKYMKISDLLAILGGMVNSLYIIVRVISYHYLNYSYSEYLKTSVSDVLKEDEDEYIRKNSMNANELLKCAFKKPSIILKEQYKKKHKQKKKPVSISTIRSNRYEIDVFEQNNLRDLIESSTPKNKNSKNKFNQESNFFDEFEIKSRKSPIKDKNIKEKFKVTKKKKENYSAKVDDSGNQNIQTTKNERLIKKFDSSKKISPLPNDTPLSLDMELEMNAVNVMNDFERKRAEVDLIQTNNINYITSSKKNHFYSAAIIRKLKEMNKNDNYCNYLYSYIFCDEERSKEYSIKRKAISKLLNVHTYCKLMVLQKEYSTKEESFIK